MLLLIMAALFELVKRIAGLFLYPLAYRTARWPRASHGFWWLWLDDSIVKDSLARTGIPLEYCSYGKKEPLGWLTEKLLPSGRVREAIRAYNWGAVRNSAVNLRDALGAGPMISVLRHTGGDRNYYELRQFEKRNLPYCQVWLTESFRLQCGWLTSGIFQIQARNPAI